MPFAYTPQTSYALGPASAYSAKDLSSYHLEAASSNSYVNGQIGPWKGVGGWMSKGAMCSLLTSLENWPNNMYYRIWRYPGTGGIGAVALVTIPLGYPNLTWGTATAWLETWCQ